LYALRQSEDEAKMRMETKYTSTSRHLFTILINGKQMSILHDYSFSGKEKNSDSLDAEDLGPPFH